MFEGYIEKILQKKLGLYIDGIDKSNFNIGIMSGNVILENLKLQKDIFKLIGFPFLLKFSKIKRLQVKVPYTSLSSKPVELFLESLTIVISPLERKDWKCDDTWSYEAKKKQVEDFIQQMAEKLRESLVEKAKDQAEGFLDKKIIKILDNIQITIKNIHLRYEDLISINELPFSFGFTLQELSIKTANQSWETCFYDRLTKENRSKPLFKMLQISGLALYVNTYDSENQLKQGSDEPDIDFDLRLEDTLFQMFPPDAIKIETASYFIEPINMEAHMTQLTRLEKDKPMYFLDFKLQELNITLTKSQYEVIVKLADIIKHYTEYLEKCQSIKKYKQWKPIYPVRHEGTKNIQSIQRRMTVRMSMIQERQKSGVDDSQSKEEKKGDSEEKKSRGEKSQYSRAETQFFDALEDQEIDDEQMKFELIMGDEDSIFKSIVSAEQKYLQKSILDSTVQDTTKYVKNTLASVPFKNLNAVEWWRFAIKCVQKDIRSQKGYWSEFKIGLKKKRHYASVLASLIYKNLNKKLNFDISQLSEDDLIILKHILEANEIADIKSWIGIAMTKKHQKILANKKKSKGFKKKEGISESESVVSSAMSFFGIKSKKQTNMKQERPQTLVQDLPPSVNEVSSPSEDDQISLSKEEMDTVVDWLNQVLETNTSAKDEELYNDTQMTLEERQQLVLFKFNISFKSGRITLTDNKCYYIKLYLDDLNLEVIYRRDQTFISELANRSVGVDIEIYDDQGENMRGKQIISPLDTELKNYRYSYIPAKLWILTVEKRSDLGVGSFFDVRFESKPLRIYYDALGFSKLKHFFKIDDCSEEIKAKAYDKFKSLKDQTQLSLKEMFQESKHQLSIKIASPILEIPFHSTLIDLPKDEFESQRYDRMWVINLGNISFVTQKQQKDSQYSLDMYERYSLNIAQVNIQYHWIGEDPYYVKVLKEIELSLDLGFQNKTKAALLVGDNSSQQDANDRAPGMKIVAKIPVLALNITPEIYNGLVNLNKVLSQNNATESLKQLKAERDSLVKESIFRGDVKTKGVKNRKKSYFESYHIIVSGSFIYFYKIRSDLVPQHFISIQECEIVTQDLSQNLVNAAQLSLKTRYGEDILIVFDNFKQSQLFTRVIKFRQTFSDNMGGGDHHDQDVPKIVIPEKGGSEMLRQNPNEVSLLLSLDIGIIDIRIHKNSENLRKALKEHHQESQWLRVGISKISVEVQTMTYDSKIKIRLQKLRIQETEKLNEDLIRNEEGANLCEIDIDSYNIYSPNIDDAEMIVQIRIGLIHFLYDPFTINNAIKFFRFTKYQDNSEFEALHQNLQQIESEEASSQNDHKFNHLKGQSCEQVKIILMKVDLSAQGINVLAVHHLYPLVPFFFLKVEETCFSYYSYYDHDIMKAEFGNVQLYDLTRYPQTIDPLSYQSSRYCIKASLDNIDLLHKIEIIGFQDLQQNKQKRNGITFECIMYQPGCPMWKTERETIFTLDIAKVKFLFIMEPFFRFLDYFLEKFLWAITEADPYLNADQIKGTMQLDLVERNSLAEISQNFYANERDLEHLDIKQPRSTTEIKMKVHRPTIVVKERPYFDRYLELDLGEIEITTSQQEVKGRFLNYPEKKVLTKSLLIDAKDLSLKVQPDNFPLSSQFDVHVSFTNLAYSPELEKIDSNHLNKYYDIDVDISPKLTLDLRQDIYTFILRCVDLNFAYTDSMDDTLYNFSNTKEYFRSTEFILKQLIKINISQSLLFVMRKADGQILTEVGLKSPQIIVERYLNSQMTVKFGIPQISSYFFGDNKGKKMLLMGKQNQPHSLSVESDIIESIKSDGASPNQLEIRIDMFSDGRKQFDINLTNLKLFLQPYYFLMLNHFFIEGMPQYEEKSFDQPNKLNFDVEDASELSCKIFMNEIIICLNPDLSDDQTIACLAQIEYTFQRNKIKSEKLKVHEKIQEQAQDPKKIQEAYFWMQLHVRQIHPFLCRLQDLDNCEISRITKREIISQFNLKYFDGKFIYWAPTDPNKLQNKQKSQLILDKLIVKVSISDYYLIMNIVEHFNSGFEKFNEYILKLKKNKNVEYKNQSNENIVENLLDEMSSFQTSAWNIMQIMSRYGQKDRNSVRPIQQQEKKPSPEEESKASQIESKIDIEKFDVKDFIVNSLGIYVVFINDSQRALQPVISALINKFQYHSIQKADKFEAEATIKAFCSYYNIQNDIWEPLLEKIILTYSKSSESDTSIVFSRDLNINITTEFLISLFKTMSSLSKQPDLHLQQNEQKVILFTVVNLCSRKIAIKKKDRLGRQITVEPGASAEYEVNYQEEAHNFLRHHDSEGDAQMMQNQVFVLKFSGESKIKEYVNLRDTNMHRVEFDKHGDYMVYGIKVENFRKFLILRSPYVITNKTSSSYCLKFVSKDQVSVDVKNIELLPGKSYPLLKQDSSLKLSLAPINTQQALSLAPWSHPVSVKTLIKSLPVNKTTFLDHHQSVGGASSFYSIVTKIKSNLDCGHHSSASIATHDILIKTPVEIINALPCALQIKNKEDEHTLKRGESVYFDTFNLVDSVKVSINAEDSRFQWTNIEANLSKKESIIVLVDRLNSKAQCEVGMQVACGESAGMRIVIYAKSAIVNNTNQNIKFWSDKTSLVAGQDPKQEIIQTCILFSNHKKLMMSMMNHQQLSSQFQVDIAGITSHVTLKLMDNTYQDFLVKTDYALANQEMDIYTQLVTVSPSIIICNETKYMLHVKQIGLNQSHQHIESSIRSPLLWSDIKKEKKFMFKISQNAESVNHCQDYEWSCEINTNDIGKTTYLAWNLEDHTQFKNIQIEKYLQEETQILFITFSEESLEVSEKSQKLSKPPSLNSLISLAHHISTLPPSYLLENRTDHLTATFNQKSYPSHLRTLQPNSQQSFSWSNPDLIESKLISITLLLDNKQLTLVEVQPDDLDFVHNFEHERIQYRVRNSTNGTSLVTVIEESAALTSPPVPQNMREYERKLDLQMSAVTLSIICKNTKGRRKEFALAALEGLQFMLIEQKERKQMQFKVRYVQIDNNIGERTLFPIILYPQENISRREIALKRKDKKKSPDEQTGPDFFNLHLQIRNTDQNSVLYLEKLEFLIQSLFLKLDDEFLVYILKFINTISANSEDSLTSSHPAFTSLKDPASTNQTCLEQLQLKTMFTIAEQESESCDEAPIITTQFNLQESNYTSQDRESVSLRSSWIEGTTSNNWLAFKGNRKDERKVYIKEYRSSPIDINLTFITRAKLELDGDTSSSTFKFKEKLMHFGLSILNTEGASIKLNALNLNNVFGPQSDITSKLTSNYIQILKSNVFQLLGNSNLVGNPIQFVNHLGTGVQDFFYEPYKGIINGPIEAVSGMATGTKSLIKNTVEGTFGSVSKMFSSLSKGMLFIADDPEFINRREEDNLEKPQNPIEGLGFGIRSTMTGVAGGLTGLFEKPIQGAQQDGVKGFFKGTLKGVSGLVIMPLSGTLDFLSKTSEGIKNMVSSNDREVSKIRILRPFYGKSQSIKIYDDFHAYIYQHLIRINREKYAKDRFLDTLYYDDGQIKKVIILTEEHFLVVDGTKKQVLIESPSASFSKLHQEDNKLKLILQIRQPPSSELQQQNIELVIEDKKKMQKYALRLTQYLLHIDEERRIVHKDHV